MKTDLEYAQQALQAKLARIRVAATYIAVSSVNAAPTARDLYDLQQQAKLITRELASAKRVEATVAGIKARRS